MLVEVLGNTVTGILNCRLMSEIQFHDMLHGVCTGRCTGTVFLEANLLQELMAMREEILYDIFLDLNKAYDDLDRDRCIYILAEYGVSLRSIRLFRLYWDRLTMVAPAGGYYGTPFKGFHGVTHGEPLSPTILNVVVDEVL